MAWGTDSYLNGEHDNFLAFYILQTQDFVLIIILSVLELASLSSSLDCYLI